ncbi:Ubiquinone/menaquinone biosynthesis C-methylase UbiE [Amycolatopsis xylanica]|uniref:Ubiquinone/menaquinone biosynthesis C-methylase UbiE n=1 Tax=Amycolatopsis xylanica TaxID=589385 RepID=A0A1H2UCX1_9PSEU|nr:methyltransferase domain-containing protein [Amycolatopsis xylanica]SDW53966.1 Ubiquinone/menaquinone biosynthesis C-methylase UbiE [Amycolatopsis xylanica]
MNSAQGITAAFDRRVATYDGNTWHARYAERLVELAFPAPGLRILDAVTGTGLAAAAAARAVGPTGHVTGVDLSPGMLDVAKETVRLPNVGFLKADATHLEQFPDAFFDMVLCSAGLLSLPAEVALAEWHRLLKPGGIVGFSTMRAGFPVAGRVFREQASAFGLMLEDPATPLGTAARCRQALRDTGFSPLDPAEEPLRFARSDLAYAWEAHARGTYHDAMAKLTAQQTASFEREFTTAIARLLRADEDRLLTAEVIYAFGRK